MSETEQPQPKASRGPRLLWTLLGAMVLVALLPLVISHYSLIGINRDSMETLEKKYLTRSAVSIAKDLENLLTSNREQLNKIASSISILQRALPAGNEPFQYISGTPWLAQHITAESDLIAIRAANLDEAISLLATHGADAKLLAGGQSLLPMLNLRVTAPGVVPLAGKAIASLAFPLAVVVLWPRALAQDGELALAWGATLIG
mgnify:CR=1 FL=1